MKRALVLTSLLIVAGLALAASMEMTSARLYKKQGEWLKSLQFYNEALQKDPENLEAYFERGDLLREIAADSSKLDMAKEIAGDAPNPQIELYKRMLADYEEAQKPRTSKDEGTAKKMTKKISDAVQREWGRFYLVAVQQDSIYETVKGSDGASQHLATALKMLDVAEMLMPERWNSYGFKAQIYGKLDSTEASAEQWSRTIEKINAADPEKQKTEEYQTGLAIARENLLVDCYNLGRRDCVMKTADELLAVDPGNINAIQLKANTLAIMTGDTSLPEAERNRLRSEAITALEKARESRPNDPDILYTIGQFHLQSGDTVAALTAINESLTANPEDEDALFLVGVLYLEGGTHVNTEKARESFKKITEINDSNAAAWTNYGVALIRLGKAEEGKAAIERAKSLSK